MLLLTHRGTQSRRLTNIEIKVHDFFFAPRTLRETPPRCWRAIPHFVLLRRQRDAAKCTQFILGAYFYMYHPSMLLFFGERQRTVFTSILARHWLW